MKKIGFLISEKENEERRALVLEDIEKIDKEKRNCLYFQKGYGQVLGVSDDEIERLGCNVVSKQETMQCDVICEPKIGDSEDLKNIKNKIIFGWVHATQNYDITQTCIDNKLTVYAWEKMFEKNRHIFYKNNQIAGQAAILHAMTCFGKSFKGLKVAVLGTGNTGFGAIEMLNSIGANVEVYNRKCENKFKEDMYKFDVIVNCVLWDVNRKDHIITIDDLKKLKKGTMIVDVSCDHNGAIESSKPTTIENPIYNYDGILHYVVDHTPTLLYKDASKSISEEIVKYINDFIEEKENKVLNQAKILDNGVILDEEINEYQNRHI